MSEFIAKIELVPVAELIPYAGNTKTHPDAHVAEIAASTREFSFVKPIITRSDLTLIAGHGALLASRKFGMERVPAVPCDYLTEARAKALVIADNKLAEGSQWDLDALKVELEGFRDLDFDTDLTAFDDDELDALVPCEQRSADFRSLSASLSVPLMLNYAKELRARRQSHSNRRFVGR